MGRLTLRNVFGKARCKKNGTKFCYETDECLYCKHNDEILERLAHYEDLEEQLMESAEIDIDNMVGEFMHYYNLQKENRLIELPCAVGDTVWFVGVQHNHYFITEYAFEIFMFDDIGNRIFLTKEEAEAKLKELEGDKE